MDNPYSYRDVIHQLVDAVLHNHVDLAQLHEVVDEHLNAVDTQLSSQELNQPKVTPPAVTEETSA